jgi:hypothetical protein
MKKTTFLAIIVFLSYSSIAQKVASYTNEFFDCRFGRKECGYKYG